MYFLFEKGYGVKYWRYLGYVGFKKDKERFYGI